MEDGSVAVQLAALLGRLQEDLQVHLRSGISTRRRRAVLAVAIVGVLATAGTIGALLTRAHTGGAAPSDRTAYTHRLGHHTVVPGAGNLSEILSAIKARYGGHDILSAVPCVARGPNPRPGHWLHFVVAAPAQDERATRPEWEADLVEGAVADALATSTKGLGVVGDSRIDLRLPDGRLVPDAGGGMGDIQPGQTFSSASTSEIEAAIGSELARRNLTPISIDVLHADQPAPAVVARTDDARGAARAANGTIRALFGIDPPTYEGYYLEVRDGNDRPVLVASAAFRSGSGRLWLRPDVEDVASLVHG
jgi:hypothetical protein